MTRISAVLAALAAAVLLAAVNGSAAPAQAPTLTGTVGPDFSIALADAQGNRVTTLNPGTYQIEVDDRSDFHSFHLRGPGVDERTDVAFTGKVTWTVTFTDGVYVYQCDPHPDLRGQFVVGNPQQPPPPPPLRLRLRLRLRRHRHRRHRPVSPPRRSSSSLQARDMSSRSRRQPDRL